MKLRIYPDKILSRRADPVATVDEAIAASTQRMFEIMYENGGIGLAAPQVGWGARVFVINLEGGADCPQGERVFINPVVDSHQGECSEEEGCLSFPGIRVDIHRPERVRVRATGLDGQVFEQESDDLLARCIQHELDHLDGILFIQHASRTQRMKMRKDLRELEREHEE